MTRVGPTDADVFRSHPWWRSVLTVGLPLVFVAGALLLLRNKLAEYHLRDILQELEDLSRWRVLLAALLAMLAYLGLTGYDWLAFRYIKHPLAVSKISIAAFISYAVSYNLGHTLITGGSVRLRLYSAWGLSALDVTRVVAFCVFTFWVGACAIVGAVITIEPDAIAAALRISPGLVRPGGLLLVCLVVAYVVVTAVRRKPVRLRQWEFPVPPVSLSVGQIVVTCIDLTLAGTVLYVLLPPSLGLSFPAVIGIYLLAVIIGLASQVPGGLGVFETAFVHLLPANVPASAVVGSLLAYRGVYFLLPLAVAALLMATQEAAFISRRVPHLREGLVRWLSSLVPPTLAFLMFVGGVILLLSNAATAAARMHWLSTYLPVRIIELSHFLGGVVGIVLILLAYALQRRLDTAYWASLTILVSGALLALLKGFNYEVAIVLLVTAAALLPCHGEFYRKGAFIREPATPVWLAAIAVVILCSAWLGLF